MKLSPERSGHGPVELDDDRIGRPDGGVDRLDRGAQRTEAVAIGRGGVDEHGVEWQRAPVEQVGHLGQEDRHVVGAALVHGLARVGPDEQRAVTEVTGHLRAPDAARPFDVEVDHPDVAQLRRPGDQRIEQDRRGRSGTVDVDLVARADPGDGLIRGHQSHGDPG